MAIKILAVQFWTFCAPCKLVGSGGRYPRTVDRVELTGLVDQATRTIAAAVLRPTTMAVDVPLTVHGRPRPSARRSSRTRAVPPYGRPGGCRIHCPIGYRWALFGSKGEGDHAVPRASTWRRC